MCLCAQGCFRHGNTLPTAEARALDSRSGRPGATLRGNSQALEKSYARLTSLPNAADVRPLPVLRQSFQLVMRRWTEERDYAYVREQLKAIRQDLTVQVRAPIPCKPLVPPVGARGAHLCWKKVVLQEGEDNTSAENLLPHV